MAPTIQKVIELQQCRIPPMADETNLTLPLTLFDMEWLQFHPIHRLLFYQFPCSTPHFTETIVPQLKKSLSLTLKHYLPLAGNLLYPLRSGHMPVFRYESGDSVSLAISESNQVSHFHNLSGHQIRNSDEFYAYVPRLPPPRNESGSRIIPLLSLQVTLFPNTGISIGITTSHAIADASAIVQFTNAWSSITKLGGDERFFESGNSKPFFDRSVIKDPNGLAIKRWNHVKKKVKTDNFHSPIPTHRVRATYILTQSDIKKLKGFVTERKRNDLIHLSSFTVTTAYVWSCLVKSEAAAGDATEEDDGDPEYFCFPADARTRCDPPIPAAYFGNCLATGFLVESTRGELKGDKGFLIAVELIGEIIRKKVNNKDEVFNGAEGWMTKYEGLAGEGVFGVAGSPRFDVYGADYGWGRPKKFEAVSIDGDRSMSLCKSRDFEGGLEIGLSLPLMVMEAFARFFTDCMRMMK